MADEMKHLTDWERNWDDRLRYDGDGRSLAFRTVLRSLAAARADAEERTCRHGWRGSVPERGTHIVSPCPACGSKSLFIGTGGHLTCGNVPGHENRGCQEPSPERAWSEMKARLASAEQDRDRLRGALEFYADQRNYRVAAVGRNSSDGYCVIHRSSICAMFDNDAWDGVGGPGSRARAALSPAPASPPAERKDDPAQDGTDFAHPAWWRGHENAVACLCQKLSAILDGKDDGRGVASPPWEPVRRRLLELRRDAERMRTLVALAHRRKAANTRANQHIEDAKLARSKATEQLHLTSASEAIGERDDLTELIVAGLLSPAPPPPTEAPAPMGSVLDRIRAAGGHAWDKVADPDKLIREDRGQPEEGPCPHCGQPRPATPTEAPARDAAVVRDPDIAGGQPTLRGTRITVAQVLAELADGCGPKEFADDFDIDARAVSDLLHELSMQYMPQPPTADGGREGVLDDGMGNQWQKCGKPDCGLEIVRPGKVQCGVVGCPMDDGGREGVRNA